MMEECETSKSENANTKQMFSKPIPMQLLYDLLESHCSRNDMHYIIDDNVYKQIVFVGTHIPFLQDLKEYYDPSKHRYLIRDFTYKSFTNIIRQICRSNDHPFYTKMQYNHSQYTILYFIQKPRQREMVEIGEIAEIHSSRI